MPRNYKVLDEYIQDDMPLKKTTHPLVVFDEQTEEYIVTLDDQTEATLYGGHRGAWAFHLADMILSKRLNVNTHVYPPWSQKFIDTIYQHQINPMRHPYTCADCGSILKPTKNGFVCESIDCEYVQYWAHGYSPDPEWIEKIKG
jgi:hypothetical protein